MERPTENYWQLRLEKTRKALEANNFQVYTAEDGSAAARIVMDQILPETGARSVSWGGSGTFTSTGLYDTLRRRSDLEIIDTFEKDLSDTERIERRRRALLVDLFVTGTNAVTETGLLVNLDMIGNRVAAITFGPKNVAILVGRNKIVPDLEEAMMRVKGYAAPVNAMRLDKKTPCAKTSYCEDCNSPDRICNHWTITEKAFPKGRIKVVLINESLGI
ncbi:lactate utilization protein [Desulfoglaeba alkanexedens]|uniref:Lactate utilization protein n=1 Tax=Desulfoglaeba alkanexedens ALDC TaxID=980445 RepID=A0A4P8L150_9BACT|nr:lactate utilization protein [Desulfoglaeba alkanexedens]QCQ21273.1 lactate utilization protein [Desulfoglaeba alkanexedens ALDC]